MAVVTFERTWKWRPVGAAIAWTVEQVRDRGYIVAGFAQTGDSTADTLNVVLVRTDSLGDTLWTAFSPGKQKGFGCQTQDGGFVVVGDTFDNNLGYGVSAMKVDSAGSMKWTRLHFSTPYNMPGAVVATEDGGVAVTGCFVSGRWERCGLLKLDSLGNQSWLKTYELAEDEVGGGYSVQQTDDGGFIISGTTGDPNGDTTYLLMVRTDSSGEARWLRMYREFGGCWFFDGYGVRQTADLGYIVTGATYDSVPEHTGSLLMKTDSAGSIVWLREHRREPPVTGRCVRQTQDLGYVVVGVEDLEMNACLVKTDSVGDTLWSRTFRPPFASHATCYWVEQTADGGYVLVGCVQVQGVTTMYAVKTDSLGMVASGLAEHSRRGLPQRALRARPNPCAGQTTLELPDPAGGRWHVDVRDAVGRVVRSLGTGHVLVWDGLDDAGLSVPAGVYFVHAADPEETHYARIVLYR